MHRFKTTWDEGRGGRIDRICLIYIYLSIYLSIYLYILIHTYILEEGGKDWRICLTYIYIYIYMYVKTYVCVCVCVCIYPLFDLKSSRQPIFQFICFHQINFAWRGYRPYVSEVAHHPGTTKASGIFTTTGRILFYNSWKVIQKETFGKLQMHCSEFHEWLIHLDTQPKFVYRPYSLVPDPQISRNCEAFVIPGWTGQSLGGVFCHALGGGANSTKRRLRCAS
jgi:hypothetical protein